MQALIAQGDNIDKNTEQQAQAAIAGPAPANPDAAAMEWMLIPETLTFIICGFFPEVEPAYTDEAKMKLARAIAPVAEKHGWNGPGDSPEITLAMGRFRVLAAGNHGLSPAKGPGRRETERGQA